MLLLFCSFFLGAVLEGLGFSVLGGSWVVLGTSAVTGTLACLCVQIFYLQHAESKCP